MLVTLTTFADLIGRSLPTVQALRRRGLPTLGRTGREHRVDVRAGLRWFVEDLEARHEEELAGVSDDPAIAAARRRKLEAEASLREQDLRERSCDWIRVATVDQRWADLVVACRERLLSLPPTALQRGLVDDAGEEALIALVDEALTELSTDETRKRAS